MATTKSAYGRGRGKPHPVDVHVGARVRARRTLLGMTQTDLANAIGLAFQQVQKYERGTNRISASKLFTLSQVFDVPVNFFFDDMPSEVAARSPTKRRGRTAEYELDPFARRETLEFVRAYYKIEDADVRQQVHKMTRVLGKGD
jgi:transcriptional regulator with XRE-family HTH domain